MDSTVCDVIELIFDCIGISMVNNGYPEMIDDMRNKRKTRDSFFRIRTVHS